MPRTDLLQGALHLLILKTLTLGPNHGWGISNRIRPVPKQFALSMRRQLRAE